MKNLNQDCFNWSVSRNKTYHVDNNKIWQVISSPSNLELFHPFCKKNPSLKWSGIDSLDEIHYYNDMILVREFTNWIDGVGYDLFIGKKNGEKSFVSWRIKDQGSNSNLSITIYPHYKNKGNRILNFAPFFIFVKPSLISYLDSVLLGLNYYIENNRKVEKNQFGVHHFFSK